MEEHLNVDKYSIQHPVEAVVVTTTSNLAYKLIPMSLEDQSLLQQKKTRLLYEISACENNVQQIEAELNRRESSIKLLRFYMHEMEQKRTSLLIELQQLHHQIDEINSSNAVRDLLRSLESLKELAAKLRAILLLKRQTDDVPAQTELIQYERRFSELYVQIQEKHDQTRKYYATYNTLLEIKELMLKETSLLNSIDLQFQDAMTSTTGRSKLVNSMEVIVKGTQQKLEKVQFSLLAEQKYSESLMEKYMTAIAEQRHFSFLLKSFQEECAKNQKLRSLTSI